VLRRVGLWAVRYGIPLAIATAGVVALAIGGDAAGAGVVLIGSAAIVFLLNLLFRISVVSNRERDAEERAREFYAKHGRWPGE
jgi:hypothetical protein